MLGDFPERLAENNGVASISRPQALVEICFETGDVPVRKADGEGSPTDISWCLFCNPLTPTPAGSSEHVFLAALGGRFKTEKALCPGCNNAFSSWDNDIADFFIMDRNALSIWSGREKPPPTLKGAHEDTEHPGVFYDLAPGMTPIAQPSKIPSKEVMTAGSEHKFVARDLGDVKRLTEVAGKRGLSLHVQSATHVTRQLPAFLSPKKLAINTGFKSVAKLAVSSACVLYGNTKSRLKIDEKIRAAARDPLADMRSFVAFGYGVEWPSITNKRPHPKTPLAKASDFDHSVVLVDVADRWVAYIEFFGGYRFVADLGNASGLPATSLIVNPMSGSCWRLLADVTGPSEFTLKSSYDSKSVQQGIQEQANRILDFCYKAGASENAEAYAEELHRELEKAGTDFNVREKAICKWAEKVASIELGYPWEEPVDISFN